MKALLIVDSEQLNTIKTKYEFHLSQCGLIISLNLDVSAVLWQLGYDHLQVSDLLSYQELQQIKEDGIRIGQSFSKVFGAEFSIDGLNLLDLEIMTMHWFFLQGIFAERLLNALTAQYAITEISFLASRQRHGQSNDLRSDALAGVWQFLLENQQDIKYNILSFSITAPKPASQKTISKLVAMAGRFGKNILSFNVFKQQNIASGKNPIFLGLLVSEVYRFSEIALALHKIFPENLHLFVSGARSAGALQVDGLQYKSLSSIPGISYLWFNYLGRKWFRHWLTIRTNTQEYPSIFHNPHLDYQFRYFFYHRLPNSIQTYRDAYKIFSSKRPTLLIMSSVQTLYARSVFEAAKQLSIPTMTIPHSGFVSRIEHQTSGDVAVSWTSDAALAWQSVKQIESPTVGLPVSLVTRGYEQQVSQSRQTQKKRITLLMVTAETALFPYTDYQRHTQTIQTLLNIPHHLQDKVHITLKLHPRHDYQYFYQYLVDQSDAKENLDIVYEQPLEDVLHHTDLAVLVTLPTSALFLPLQMQIPLLYIQTAPHHSQTMRLADWGGSAVIRDFDKIWQTIEATLFDEDRKQQLLADNQKYWQRIQPENGDPIQNLIRLIKQMVDD